MTNSGKTVIAIVDDEETILKGLERLLRSAGLAAKTFATGVDFLRSLENGTPDCLVLDLNMMPMNGLAVLDRLALSDRKLPVIVITGDDREEIHQAAVSRGIAAFLRKPVEDEVLLDAIDKAIRPIEP